MRRGQRGSSPFDVRVLNDGEVARSSHLERPSSRSVLSPRRLKSTNPTVVARAKI